MEPVFMMIGHAAGAAASLAIERKVTVQDVPYAPLRERLLADKQILDRAPPRPASAAKAQPPSPTAANAQLLADLKVLVKRKIVDSPDYWLAHARKGQQCDGEKVAELFVKMAQSFKPVNGLTEAVPVLFEKKLFNSPDYWLQRAVPGGKCSGEYVAGIIGKYVASLPATAR